MFRRFSYLMFRHPTVEQLQQGDFEQRAEPSPPLLQAQPGRGALLLHQHHHHRRKWQWLRLHAQPAGGTLAMKNLPHYPDWLVQVWWLAGLRLWRVARSRHSSRLWGTEHWNGRQVWFFTRVQLCDNENNPIRLHSYQSSTMCICAEYVLLLELPQSNRYYWMRWPPKKWQSSQIWGRVDCGNIIHAFPSFCWSSASRALPKSAMNLLKHEN